MPLQHEQCLGNHSLHVSQHEQCPRLHILACELCLRYMSLHVPQHEQCLHHVMHLTAHEQCCSLPTQHIKQGATQECTKLNLGEDRC